MLKKSKDDKWLKNKEVSNKKLEKQRKKEEKLKIKEEKKNLKNEYKKVDKVVAELLPFLDELEDETFKTKFGYMNIFQIGTKDLNSLSDSEIENHIIDFGTFLRSCNDDIKIVSMTYPVNTEIQQKHLLKKIENTKEHLLNKKENTKADSLFLPFLEVKLEELTLLEEIRYNKEYYLFTFYEDEKSKKERERSLRKLKSRTLNLKNVPIDKKRSILFKLNNLNSKI